MTMLPKEISNQEFIFQFKTKEDVSQFMTNLHSQLLGQHLQPGMDEHLGYEKNQVEGNSSGVISSFEPTEFRSSKVTAFGSVKPTITF